MAVISVLYTGATTIYFKQHLSYIHEAEWAPYFSENLVEPGIEPGLLDL
jgi:hypothetical protein